MTAGDWAAVGMATNESVLQWYSTVTQKPIAGSPNVISTPLPGGGYVSVGNSSLFMLGALALLAWVLLRK